MNVTSNEQLEVSPAWLMATVRPPAVIEPDLDAPLFAATEYVTVPLPLPDEPEVIVIHDADAVAVQAHPVCVVTTIE